MTLKIDVSRLRHRVGATERFKLTSDGGLLPPDIGFVEPPQIDIEVTNLGLVYKLEGTISAQLKANCGRCLDDVLLPLEVNFSEKLIDSNNISSIGEITQKELEEEYRLLNKDTIDMTETIVENIFNGLPVKILCKPDCLGLCAKCGGNLNNTNCDCIIEDMDPRLAILANFYKD